MSADMDMIPIQDCTKAVEIAVDSGFYAGIILGIVCAYLLYQLFRHFVNPYLIRFFHAYE